MGKLRFGLVTPFGYDQPHGAWRSLVSALVWGTRGPEFKSRRPDEKALFCGAFLGQMKTIYRWVG